MMPAIMRKTFLLSAALASLWALAIQPAQARDQIRIVGSSTVFPFSTAVAEEFGTITSFRTPVVESTGTGGGMKLFCSGVGTGHPDVTNASRRIKKSEMEKCASNGVTHITEIKIGFDGIVLANSLKAPMASFTLRHIFLGLAKQVPADKTGAMLRPNPYKKWSDIDPSLPEGKIEVLGPPPPSSAGVHIIEMLNVLEGFELGALGFGAPATLHLVAEALKLAFADRKAVTADPDFAAVPVDRLISKGYGHERRGEIDPERARDWDAGLALPQSPNTTHVTVADGEGNIVASTQTINICI